MDSVKRKPGWTGKFAEPGALYNLGNLIGLGAGLGAALSAPHFAEGRANDPWSRCIEFVAGSPAALAITLATLVFFWGGFVYSKAWANGAPPEPQLNRQGDLLSGIGAICLAIGLVMVGDPFLAASAGCLHALGKFGSAIYGGPERAAGHGPNLYSASKDLVLASRIPALMSALVGFDGDVLSVSLVVCTLIWAEADWKLLTEESFWKRFWHRFQRSKIRP